MMINPAARDGAQDAQDVRQDIGAHPPARFFGPSPPIRRAGGSSSSAQPEPARGGWWWWCCLVFPVTYVRCTFRMCCTTPGTPLLCNSQLPSKTDGTGRNRQASARARPGEARPGLRRKEGEFLRLFVLVVWLRAVGWWWCCCGCVLVQTGWCCGLFLVLPARCR